MKLYIDTSSAEKIVIGISESIHETDARQAKSQKLLPFIIEKLSESGKSFKDLTQIEVNTGPGSFTGLRVGVSVANALGWALGIPVNGENISEKNVISPTYFLTQ